MIKAKHHRPFNMIDAKLGAPYECENGTKVRIICWDKKNSNNCIELIGLRESKDIHPVSESVISYKESGQLFIHSLNRGFDLVMIPNGYVEGFPVFTGDTLEVLSVPDKNEWMLFKIDPSFRPTSYFTYRWPKRPILLDDKPVELGMKVWYKYQKSSTEFEWLERIVNSADLNCIEGRNGGSKEYSKYSWNRPAILDGRRVEEGMEIWFKRIRLGKNFYWELKKLGKPDIDFMHVHANTERPELWYSWHEPKSNIQRYQALLRNETGPWTLDTLSFDSEQACTDACKNYSTFVRAVPTFKLSK
jgi:hypothetical protein